MISAKGTSETFFEINSLGVIWQDGNDWLVIKVTGFVPKMPALKISKIVHLNLLHRLCDRLHINDNFRLKMQFCRNKVWNEPVTLAIYLSKRSVKLDKSQCLLSKWLDSLMMNTNNCCTIKIVNSANKHFANKSGFP